MSFEATVEPMPCGCTLATVTTSDGTKTYRVLTPSPLCMDHTEPIRLKPERLASSTIPASWVWPATEYPDLIREWITRQLSVQCAVADVMAVRALAAHPWALHWLAAQPAWAPYADMVRRT